MLHFPRTSLAAEMVKALKGEAALSDAPNGLFLAAPRRTGKTAFLRNDLIPALETAGVFVLYVDLWAQKDKNPGELIIGAIAAGYHRSLNFLKKASQAVGGKVTAPFVELDIDLSRIGRPDGATVPEALAKLQGAVKRPVCLVIDEAQHALTTVEGNNAMAALKSARDQMNQPGSARLMLVMSGSDRDKLLRLVNTNAAPFFGSQITKMQLLGSDFVAHIRKEIELLHPALKPVDKAHLEEVFSLFGARPQFFIAAIDMTIAEGSGGKAFGEALLERSRKAVTDAEEEMAACYCALPPLQQAVLWWMFEAGPRFRPYDATALKFYREKTGRSVQPARAQQAIDALRNRDDPLVWRSSRGEYAVEDSGMLRWFERLKAAGGWPPSLG